MLLDGRGRSIAVGSPAPGAGSPRAKRGRRLRSDDEIGLAERFSFCGVGRRQRARKWVRAWSWRPVWQCTRIHSVEQSLHELRTRGEMQKMQKCDGHPVLSEKNHWKTAPARERKCSDCGGAQCVHAPTRGPIFPAKGYLLDFELIFLMLFVITRTLVRQHF